MDVELLPILDIYRRYYGGRMMLHILATYYVAMAAAGYVVEIVIAALCNIPSDRSVTVIHEGPTWNYTSVLNIVFLAVAALLWRFFRTGGREMLAMLDMPQEEMEGHDGSHAREASHQSM